ncbi:unnamed protein product [Anisakis simplex]|uniref:Uncharacterized protein n=1 Tax=Anisakis simplex TaxID=6269 RepID=A0A0M3KGW1_ANISI|nr:unnamed protein product [Anisakis simplex]
MQTGECDSFTSTWAIHLPGPWAVYLPCPTLPTQQVFPKKLIPAISKRRGDMRPHSVITTQQSTCGAPIGDHDDHRMETAWKLPENSRKPANPFREIAFPLNSPSLRESSARLGPSSHRENGETAVTDRLIE